MYQLEYPPKRAPRDSAYGSLRVFMHSRGYTASDLADFCKTSHYTVQSWMSGRRNPSVAMRLLIEQFTDGAIRPLQWATAEEIADAKELVGRYERGEIASRGYVGITDRSLLRAYLLLEKIPPRAVVEHARQASERRSDDRRFLKDSEMFEQAFSKRTYDPQRVAAIARRDKPVPPKKP